MANGIITTTIKWRLAAINYNPWLVAIPALAEFRTDRTYPSARLAIYISRIQKRR